VAELIALGMEITLEMQETKWMYPEPSPSQHKLFLYWIQLQCRKIFKVRDVFCFDNTSLLSDLLMWNKVSYMLKMEMFDMLKLTLLGENGCSMHVRGFEEIK
jgi:hypothetical protein